jgi:deoxyribonuclease V
MQLITDVHYFGKGAQAAGILFEWDKEEIIQDFRVSIDEVSNYEPGYFYKRELPCLISLLEQITLSEVDIIIIDGFVFLDDDSSPGLGKHLYDFLEKKIPVIGIGKTGYHGIRSNVREVKRGNSDKPLFVTSVGLHPDEAASLVKGMHGNHRLPTMVGLVDQLSRKLL